MDEASILGELDKIKRVLTWMLLDRQISNIGVHVPDEVRKHWQEEYLWVIDYLPHREVK